MPITIDISADLFDVLETIYYAKDEDVPRILFEQGIDAEEFAIFLREVGENDNPEALDLLAELEALKPRNI